MCDVSVSHFHEFGWWMQIVIISNEDVKKEFISDVGEDILPEEYGGREKLVAIQDVEVIQIVQFHDPDHWK
jgi:hypothetical protein